MTTFWTFTRVCLFAHLYICLSFVFFIVFIQGFMPVSGEQVSLLTKLISVSVSLCPHSSSRGRRGNTWHMKNTICCQIDESDCCLFSSLPVRCLWPPVNVWMELPVWPTLTSPPAAGSTCACVSTGLKAKGARWTSTTANRTPADWAAVLTGPTRSPVSAHREWQVWIDLQSCFLPNTSTRSKALRRVLI